MISQWNAHKDRVVAITAVSSTECFITASADKHIKVWSLLGEEMGDILISGEDTSLRWNFPMNLTEVRKKEKEVLIKALKELEPSNRLEKDEIEYVDGCDSSNLKKKKKPEVIPKRSLAEPHLIEKIRGEEAKEENTLKEKYIKEEGERNPVKINLINK